VGVVQEVTLVVPCYNEERRLDKKAFLGLAHDSEIGIVFVDDGSRDGTRTTLSALCEQDVNLSLVALERNVGKAEAVRQGLLHALDGGARIVGYIDADLATPPREIKRLVGVLRDTPGLDVVLAARVARLGANIQRNSARHYLGRVFASAASLVLSLRVYDTQCGAKVMRSSPALHDALREPFLSRWAFDVELLGRLLAGSADAAPVSKDAFLEVPLEEWRDVAGTRLRLGSMVRATVHLLGIRRALADRRRAAARAGHPSQSRSR
jgi:dolichyl-phosphate beta-glucosyltransferase